MSRTVLSIVWYVVWYVNRGLKVDDTSNTRGQAQTVVRGNREQGILFLFLHSDDWRHGNPMARRGAARSALGAGSGTASNPARKSVPYEPDRHPKRPETRDPGWTHARGAAPFLQGSPIFVGQLDQNGRFYYG